MFVWLICLHVYRIMCIHGAHRGQKKASVFQELKLRVVVSYHVGVSTKGRSFARALTHWAILPLMGWLWNNSGPQGREFLLAAGQAEGRGTATVFIRGGFTAHPNGTVLIGMTVTTRDRVELNGVAGSFKDGIWGKISKLLPQRQTIFSGKSLNSAKGASAGGGKPEMN